MLTFFSALGFSGLHSPPIGQLSQPQPQPQGDFPFFPLRITRIIINNTSAATAADTNIVAAFAAIHDIISIAPFLSITDLLCQRFGFAILTYKQHIYHKYKYD